MWRHSTGVGGRVPMRKSASGSPHHGRGHQSHGRSPLTRSWAANRLCLGALEGAHRRWPGRGGGRRSDDHRRRIASRVRSADAQTAQIRLWLAAADRREWRRPTGYPARCVSVTTSTNDPAYSPADFNRASPCGRYDGGVTAIFNHTGNGWRPALVAVNYSFPMASLPAVVQSQLHVCPQVPRVTTRRAARRSDR